MKLAKSLLLAVMILSLSSAGRAQDFDSIAPKSFLISATNLDNKLNDIIRNPINVLKRYRPAGAEISNKKVSQDSFSFVATKKKFGFSKSVFIKGNLKIEEERVACLPNERSYSIIFDFSPSDSLIATNVDQLELNLCVLFSAKRDSLNARFSGKIYRNPGGEDFVYNYIRDLIALQVSPLIDAFQSELLAN